MNQLATKKTPRHSVTSSLQSKPKSDRNQRKKSQTRFVLLETAYLIMSMKGIDATTVSDITSTADVGLGTFYNYFARKEDLVIVVLDCIIRDLCDRNDVATASLRQKDPAAGHATAIRLALQEMLANPMWKWWFKRPDLLADLLRKAAYQIGTRDIKAAIEAGVYEVPLHDVEEIWAQQVWLIVGGIKDILDGKVEREKSEAVLIQTIMRAIGLPPEAARKAAKVDLPEVRPPMIRF